MRVVILVERLYEDLELWYPKIFFESIGVDVAVAGKEKKEYAGKNGYRVVPDVLFSLLRTEDFDGVIVPGGFAPDYLRRSKRAVTFVSDMDESGKVVAAICHGGWMIISSGVAKGRKLTGYHSIKDDLVNAGAEYLDKQVVVDGNLITSRFPADLPWFCDAIAVRLGFPADGRLR